MGSPSTQKQRLVVERDGAYCRECYRPVLFPFMLTENEQQLFRFTSRKVYKNGYKRRQHLVRRGTIDHVIPQAHGGTHELGNLRILCYDCNNERGTKPIHQFLRCLVPRQPLSSRYPSTAITILETAGIRLDAYSILGDTITAEASGQAVVNALVAGGGVMLDYLDFPNRLYCVIRLESRIVSVKWQKGSILTDILHWSAEAKFEKTRNPVDTAN